MLVSDLFIQSRGLLLLKNNSMYFIIAHPNTSECSNPTRIESVLGDRRHPLVESGSSG
jgi:hypothetical protein